MQTQESSKKPKDNGQPLQNAQPEAVLPPQKNELQKDSGQRTGFDRPLKDVYTLNQCSESED